MDIQSSVDNTSEILFRYQRSLSKLFPRPNAASFKESYCPPELIPIGSASDLLSRSSGCKSELAAKKIRQSIDESRGSLSFSPAKECQRLQVSLPLVSRRFKKLYGVTMRGYARQIRMNTAEKILRESNYLNIDEMARVFGYSFTSAFSRCFNKTFGERPKSYQVQRASASKDGGPQSSLIGRV